MSIYPKVPYVVGKDVSLLQCERNVCKKVAIRRNLPGNIVVVHGVNDLGVSYQAVEHGLCDGLRERLGRGFTPASYRMPVAADKASCGMLYNKEIPSPAYASRTPRNIPGRGLTRMGQAVAEPMTRWKMGSISPPSAGECHRFMPAHRYLILLNSQPWLIRWPDW